MEIGSKIKKSRIDAKLTQEQAAEALGISRQTISNWENEKSYPDIVSVLKMSDLYGVSLDYLLKGDSAMKNYLDCNGVQREHNKKLNNGLPILHKVPPKRDYGRYFCIMAEKGGTSHGGLTEKLSPFFHAKKQEVNAYGR